MLWKGKYTLYFVYTIIIILHRSNKSLGQQYEDSYRSAESWQTVRLTKAKKRGGTNKLNNGRGEITMDMTEIQRLDQL